MKETEIKILNINKNKITQTLSNLGAKKIFDDEVTTIFFDFSDSRIANAKNLLRLRQAGPTSTLTYKKIITKESVKEAEEYEVQISSIETTKKILESLELVETYNLQKHRTSYKITNVRFDIDTFTGNLNYIPTFLEIESEKTEQIYKYAELLGFSPKDCLPWSTEEVINHYSKNKQTKSRSFGNKFTR